MHKQNLAIEPPALVEASAKNVSVAKLKVGEALYNALPSRRKNISLALEEHTTLMLLAARKLQKIIPVLPIDVLEIIVRNMTPVSWITCGFDELFYNHLIINLAYFYKKRQDIDNIIETCLLHKIAYPIKILHKLNYGEGLVRRFVDTLMEANDEEAIDWVFTNIKLDIKEKVLERATYCSLGVIDLLFNKHANKDIFKYINLQEINFETINYICSRYIIFDVDGVLPLMVGTRIHRNFRNFKQIWDTWDISSKLSMTVYNNYKMTKLKEEIIDKVITMEAYDILDCIWEDYCWYPFYHYIFRDNNFKLLQFIYNKGYFDNLALKEFMFSAINKKKLDLIHYVVKNKLISKELLQEIIDRVNIVIHEVLAAAESFTDDAPRTKILKKYSVAKSILEFAMGNY